MSTPAGSLCCGPPVFFVHGVVGGRVLPGAKAIRMDYALSMVAPLWQGATVTLKLFFITLALAVPLGLALALARLSGSPALSALVNGYIWLMRGTPLMLQMLFIYFALPFVPVIGVRLPDFPAAVLAFALNYAAYFAEIFRAGIQSIDKGQYEAARGIVQRDFTTTPFIVAAAFYLAMTLVLTWGFQTLEKRYARHDA